MSGHWRQTSTYTHVCEHAQAQFCSSLEWDASLMPTRPEQQTQTGKQQTHTNYYALPHFF